MAHSSSAFVQVTEVAKKSEDSAALGLEVRLEKGCMSRAEVEALGGGGGGGVGGGGQQLEYSAERRCWVGRKIEKTREATKEQKLDSRELPILI